MSLTVLALLATGATTAAGPSRIAFVSKRDAPHDNSELYVMNADGSNQHRVRTSPGLDENRSSWSPDGLRLAFESGRPGYVRQRIAVLGPRGGVKALTPASESIDSREPAWSPDGARIAFSRSTGNGYRLMTMNPNGSGLTPLTPGRFDREPTWSPDGKQIAFTHDARLWVANADGTGARAIPGGYVLYPAWSPDGKTVAFTRPSATGAGELYTVRITGGRARRLTTTPRSELHPSWSPDGSQIAYQLGSTPPTDIWVMKADGTGARRLTTDGRSALPAWTR